MTDTQEVQTQYGTVEVETVDCDSCGTTIAKDESHEFTLGDRGGHACQHCVDNGPISFPPSVDFNIEPAEQPLGAAMFWVLLFPVLIGETVVGNSENAAIPEWLSGSLGALLWTTLPLCLLIYFGVV